MAEYTLSTCSQHAFDRWWPDHVGPDVPDFSSRMKRLFGELVMCHFPDMDDECRERAKRSLAALGIDYTVVLGDIGLVQLSGVVLRL